MTAISVVSSVLERLKYLEGQDHIPKNPNFLDELKDEVEMLHKELEKAKDVLIEAHMYRKENDKAPEAEKQIIWLFYECEDVIEKYVHEITNRLNGRTPIIKRYLKKKIIKNASHNVRDLTTKIQEGSEKCKVTRKLKRTASAGEISNRVLLQDSILRPSRTVERKIKRVLGSSGDRDLSIGSGETTLPIKEAASIERAYKMTPLTKDESWELFKDVGEQSRKLKRTSSAGNIVMPAQTRLQTEGSIDVEQKIKHVLCCHDRGLSIISIWGPKGSRKTTLARKMYEEAKIAGIFGRFAWFHVPNRFETKSVLVAILAQLCVKHNKEELKEMDDMKLAHMLHKVLQQNKCLIVIDNMWSHEVWLSIRIAFPFRDTGSKVLLTTQVKNVAEEVASTMERAYEMMLPTMEESWEMFKKNAQSRDDGDNKWQRVLNVLQDDTCLSSEQKFVKAVGLRYCELPYNLQTCFLYLGLFPEDQEIRVQTLSLLLMAEGIVPLKHTKNDDTVDTTELFLYELAQKSLVEIEEEEEPKFRNFKSCRLLDLIRDLSISKGKEEEFFEVVGIGNESKPSFAPRVAIHLNKYKDERCAFEKSKVRSLLLFETQDFQTKSSWPPQLSDLKDLEWLRILHFDGVDFKARNLPKGLDKLACLRYLSFLGCELEKLPEYISNLPYIQTLDLRVRGKMTIPNVLSKMKRLRHLYFPVMYVNEFSGKLSLDGLIELEILENFDTRICSAVDLSKFKKLRVLKIIAEGNINDLKVIIKCLENNLSGLQLSFLDLRNFDCYTNERLWFIKSLPSLVALHTLHLQGYIRNFPEKLQFSRNFMELSLNGTELKEDPMSILGRLPNLRSLILINDAFMGTQMECGESHFPKLRSLKLLHLTYLETWNVVEGSMPKLSMMTIENCCGLLMIPPGLKFIKSLQGLKIVSMPTIFKYTIQQEYGKELNDDRVLQGPTIVFES